MRPLLLVLPLLAAACAPLPDAPDANAADACGAGRLDGQQGIALEELVFTAQGIVRTIRPGDAITMDFNARRLNLVLDGADRLERAYCG